MNRRVLLGTGGTLLLAGCTSRVLDSDQTAEDNAVDEIREFLESDSAYSSEIHLLDAGEMIGSDRFDEYYSIGLRHTLPSSLDRDEHKLRNAVNTNAYSIAEISLDHFENVFEVLVDSYTYDEDDSERIHVSYVRLRWDAFEEYSWEDLSPSDVPDVAVKYEFDRSGL